MKPDGLAEPYSYVFVNIPNSLRLSQKSSNFAVGEPACAGAAKSNEDEIVYFLGYWGIDGLYRVNKLSFLARKPGSESTNRSLKWGDLAKTTVDYRRFG